MATKPPCGIRHRQGGAGGQRRGDPSGRLTDSLQDPAHDALRVHADLLLQQLFVKPIDEEAVAEACGNHNLIVAMEENVACGGYGEKKNVPALSSFCPFT